VTPWTVWPALGQPVYVSPGLLNGNANSGAVFASEAERRLLLGRMLSYRPRSADEDSPES